MPKIVYRFCVSLNVDICPLVNFLNYPKFMILFHSVYKSPSAGSGSIWLCKIIYGLVFVMCYIKNKSFCLPIGVIYQSSSCQENVKQNKGKISKPGNYLILELVIMKEGVLLPAVSY